MKKTWLFIILSLSVLALTLGFDSLLDFQLIKSMKVDPIIAVKNVQESSAWYQAVLGLRSKHGGDEFEILVTKEDEVMICLHKWGEHEHATMKNPNITPGNGLILYIRTENLEAIRQQLKETNYAVEAEIQLNPNSQKREFSIIDPNGYHLIISEFHEFEG